MKTFLMVAVLATLGMVATASAQTFVAPTPAKQQQAAKPTPTPSKAEVTGVVPRAIRGGNPVQMLNPRAPAKYGTAQESVTVDPKTGKWKGIKLFSFVF